jgi:hypothetical protein
MHRNGALGNPEETMGEVRCAAAGGGGFCVSPSSPHFYECQAAGVRLIGVSADFGFQGGLRRRSISSAR